MPQLSQFGKISSSFYTHRYQYEYENTDLFLSLHIIENVQALQKLVDEMDPSDMDIVYPVRSIISDLLPIEPVSEWEAGYRNRTTPEEVADWMEGKFLTFVRSWNS